jgi:hypothetical protein
MESNIPKIIEDVGFDFDWDEEKVWKLNVPVTDMDIKELVWHFDIPFLWHKGGVYNLTPREVIENPRKYEDEYQRTVGAELKYPIDIMENKGRWLILDGLHRLMKAHIQGTETVNVRIIPRDKITEILRDDKSRKVLREAE